MIEYVTGLIWNMKEELVKEDMSYLILYLECERTFLAQKELRISGINLNETF